MPQPPPTTVEVGQVWRVVRNGAPFDLIVVTAATTGGVVRWTSLCTIGWQTGLPKNDDNTNGEFLGAVHL